MTESIFIIAGEASADVYAAQLIRKTLAQDSNIKFYGMGGKLMREAGGEVIIDYKKLAIVGFTEILTNLALIWRTLKSVKETLTRDRPDLLILIDYPGFNLRIAKVAHKLGIKVLYYVSPQLWAWHKSRIEIIKENVDHMAVILPFEVDMYKEAGVPVTFVGHPLLEIVKPTVTKDVMRQQLEVTQHQNLIGLVPGSRLGEIKKLLPVMLEAAQLLKLKFPNAEFVLSLASSLQDEDVAPFLRESQLKIHLTRNATHNTIQACDAVIACSGTVTLETCLLKIPFVLVYKTSKLTYFLGKRLVKIPFAGLGNIIANKEVFPELIQDEANPQKIATEITKLIEDKKYRNAMLKDFDLIRNKLTSGSQNRIVSLVLSLL